MWSLRKPYRFVPCDISRRSLSLFLESQNVPNLPLKPTHMTKKLAVARKSFFEGFNPLGNSFGKIGKSRRDAIGYLPAVYIDNQGLTLSEYETLVRSALRFQDAFLYDAASHEFDKILMGLLKRDTFLRTTDPPPSKYLPVSQKLFGSECLDEIEKHTEEQMLNVFNAIEYPTAPQIGCVVDLYVRLHRWEKCHDFLKNIMDNPDIVCRSPEGVHEDVLDRMITVDELVPAFEMFTHRFTKPLLKKIKLEALELDEFTGYNDAVKGLVEKSWDLVDQYGIPKTNRLITEFVDTFSTLGNREIANFLFGLIESPTTVNYNSMIDSSGPEEALRWYGKLKSREGSDAIVPNQRTFLKLMKVACKFDNMEMISFIIDEMKENRISFYYNHVTQGISLRLVMSAWMKKGMYDKVLEMRHADIHKMDCFEILMKAAVKAKNYAVAMEIMDDIRVKQKRPSFRFIYHCSRFFDCSGDIESYQLACQILIENEVELHCFDMKDLIRVCENFALKRITKKGVMHDLLKNIPVFD